MVYRAESTLALHPGTAANDIGGLERLRKTANVNGPFQLIVGRRQRMLLLKSILPNDRPRVSRQLRLQNRTLSD